MDASGVRDAATDLPREPGVYQFLEDGEVLYVGKAVDLADRVRSYADPRSERVARMVRRADDVDVAVTDTERQALLLEANQIKRLAPRYNVRLRDDKSFPLVQLTDHEAPRIEVTRDPEPEATVFGPFTSRAELDVAVKAIRDVYGLRGCSDHKYANRERPCLDYDIGLCIAPCTGECEPAAYEEAVDAARRFFAGETGALADPLRSAMAEASAADAYERAATLRDRLRVVEAFHEGGPGGAVADPSTDAGRAEGAGGGEPARVRDVLGVAVEGGEATVARLRSEDGQLVERDRHVLAGEAATPGAALAAFLPQFYAERPLPDELLCSHALEEPALVGDGGVTAGDAASRGDATATGGDPAATAGDAASGADAAAERDEPAPQSATDVEAWLADAGVELRVPGAGAGGRLVELALKNARRRSPDRDELAALGDALGIDRPVRIEGFDVSHTGGRGVVGSDVTFVEGRPETDDYRRKKLPEGNDDPAAMRALVAWRADRALAGRDDRPDPDLLVVDGGEAQVAAARAALDGAREDDGEGASAWDVPLVGLAKGPERRDAATDEVWVADRGADDAAGAAGAAGAGGGGGARRLDWPGDSPQLRLLQRVRDEAHRFAVRYHETVRDDVSTVLEEIDGVGAERRRRLLRRFGSVRGIREASRAELEDVPGIGAGTAETIDRRL